MLEYEFGILEQEKYVGNQIGARVYLFLYTDDFNRDYSLLFKNGVEIVRPPKTRVDTIIAHAKFNEKFYILLFIFVSIYINNSYELFVEPTRYFPENCSNKKHYKNSRGHASHSTSCLYPA
jgi:hypothetical protein